MYFDEKKFLAISSAMLSLGLYRLNTVSLVLRLLSMMSLRSLYILLVEDKPVSLFFSSAFSATVSSFSGGVALIIFLLMIYLFSKLVSASLSISSSMHGRNAHVYPRESSVESATMSPSR